MTDREKLIELILGWGGLSNCAEDMADYFIDDGVTIQKWIPVTERLPEKGEWVLCVGKRGGLFLADGMTVFSDGSCYCSVPNARSGRYATHWMPLPEPPIEERK